MTAFEDRNTQEFEATSAGTANPARAILSLDVADRLLELLSTDDEFRSRFESNPRAALREIGYETLESRLGVFGLDPVVSFSHIEGGLASKATLAAVRRTLRGENPTVFGPFDICAG